MSSGKADSVEASEQDEFKPITLKINLPKGLVSNNEQLEVPSSLDETIADVKQSLNILPVSRNLTNYNIFIQNVNISEVFDDLTSFRSIVDELGLNVDNHLNLILKEKPYNLAAVYECLTRFRESIGLHYLDKLANDFGASGGVSKFNDLNLSPVKESIENIEEEKTFEDEGKEESKPTEIKVTDEEKAQLKDISEDFLSSKSSSLKNHGEFSNVEQNIKIPIKSLSISQWSPVPPAQQIKGDLLYLTLQTLENETYHITCHMSGFFVNKSSSVNYNPDTKINEKGKFFKNYLLYGLVETISPLFSKVVQENELYLTSISEHPETYLLPTNSFLEHPWLVSDSIFQKPDVSRSQLPLISNGVDGSAFIKEWNDDIQAIRELPNSTINERILKERLVNKSLYEFNTVATETAINIIRGNITPMNPNEPIDQHIYLKNGIFYSFGLNSTGAFDTTGGDEAARYTSSKDLAAIKVLNRFDVSGVSNLVTCIVDYIGKRVICQAPVPGIFSGEEDVDKVSYGLTTDGSKVLNDSSFEDGLKQVAEVFHLKPHTVELSDSIKSEGELLISKDTKGIFGTDKRKYIIDLYRSTPLDIEFIENHWNADDEKSYPHKETVLRHEAVEEWWKRKVSVLIKEETDKLEKGGEKIESSEGEKPKIVIPTNQVVLNPDSFSAINVSPEDEADVRNLSKFIKEQLIREFLEEFPSQLAPFDGSHLTTVLHKHGINLRYLGYIAEQALICKENQLKKDEELKLNNFELVSQRKAEEEAKAKKEAEEKEDSQDNKSKEEEEKTEEKEQPSKGTFEPNVANYSALYRILLQEMVARSFKHIMRKYTAQLPSYLTSYVIAHLHNCLLASDISGEPELSLDSNISSFCEESYLEFTKVTSSDVLKLVSNEVFIRFRYSLPDNWLEFINPLSLFREIAIKFGIQWKAQNYVFSKDEFETFKKETLVNTQIIEQKTSKKNKKKITTTLSSTKRSTVFVADDIINFVPVVKDSTYKASIVDDIFETARVHIIKGEKDLGITYLNDLSAIYEQIYGRVNRETSKFYVNLAQLYSELGLTNEACTTARKAIIMNERTNGFDSHETISTYINAAFFEVANEDFVNGFKLYKQAINNWSLVYGSDHPSLVTTIANLADMLVNAKLIKPAVSLLEQALDLSIKLNGEDSQLTALIYYRIGNLEISNDNLAESVRVFQLSHDIFNKVLGPDDYFSKQTGKYVTNIQNYMKYLEFQDKQKKAQVAQQNQKTNGKVKAKLTEQTTTKKTNKKTSVTQPDPDIASKSVDDILKFIEGDQNKKSSKKTKSKN